MRTLTHLRICAYLAALLGLWSVTLTEHFSAAWLLVTTGIVAAGWFYEGPRKYRDSYRRIWLGVGFCGLLFFPFDVALSRSLLIPAVHISMFAQAFFLFNKKDTQVYSRMFLVSFAQLLAATNLTTGIAFAVVLTAFCVVSAYGIVLLHLLREAESGKTDRARVQEVPQGLIFSSILLTLTLFPLILGFFYTTPRLQYALVGRSDLDQALQQIQNARQRTGFTKTIQLGSYGRIQQDNTLALRVELPNLPGPINEPVRWRGGAVNIYDGMAWSSSRDFFTYYNGRQWNTSGKNSGMVFPRAEDLFITDERFADYQSERELDAEPTLLKQVFYLEIPYSDSIFGAGRIAAIEGPFTYGLGRDFNGSFYIQNRQAVPELISYTVYSRLDQPDSDTLRQVSRAQFEELINNEGYGDYVKTNYLQLPTRLNPRIKELAFQITERERTPYDKVNAIKRFLETNYEYSLDPGAPATDDPLYDFLFINRSGHCEYFATALTLMTRMVDIPARLARGFQKGEWNEDGEFYEIRQRDAHAWVEIYFPDYGWIAFDPSPRATADEYFQNRRSRLARWFSRKSLLMQLQWRRYVIGYNEASRLRLFGEIKRLFLNGPSAVVAFVAGAARAIWGFLMSGWFVLMLAGAGLFALLARYREKIPLRVPRLPWLTKPRRRGAAFYERMLKALEKRKIVKPASLTPLEFLRSPAVNEHPLSGDIETLTSLYYRVRFGGECLAENDMATVNDILTRLRRSNGRAGYRETIQRA